MVDWAEEDLVSPGPPRRDPWDDYAVEKVTDLLLLTEMRQDDRNGHFTWTWVWGAALVAAGIFQIWSNSAIGKADWWPAMSFLIGVVLLIVGITLRVNGGLELGRIRRMQKLVAKGIFPRP